MYYINYDTPIHFGKMRGFTGRDLTLSRRGRQYLRWAARSGIPLSYTTRQEAKYRGRLDY